jgi:hypothetical protein
MAVQVPAQAEGVGSPLYAVTQSGTSGRLLTKLDPATLSSVGPSARLSASAEPAAFSLDGSLLAVVQWAAERPSVADPGELDPDCELERDAGVAYVVLGKWDRMEQRQLPVSG